MIPPVVHLVHTAPPLASVVPLAKINACCAPATISPPTATLPALSISLTTRPDGVVLVHGGHSARTSALVVPKTPALDMAGATMGSTAMEPAHVPHNFTGRNVTMNVLAAVLVHATMEQTERGLARATRATMVSIVRFHATAVVALATQRKTEPAHVIRSTMVSIVSLRATAVLVSAIMERMERVRVRVTHATMVPIVIFHATVVMALATTLTKESAHVISFTNSAQIVPFRG
jgi:hypothetical protein